MTLKKQIENAMRNSSPDFETRHLDFCIGDIVQVRRHGKRFGRFGRIIGISFNPIRKYITYTVQFSDKEASAFSSFSLRFVRSEDLPKAEQQIAKAITSEASN